MTETGQLAPGQTHRIEHFLQDRKLGGQLIRHGTARGLIGIEFFMPEGFFLPVEADDRAVGHFLPQTGHLYACRLLTFASTYTVTTPSDDVSILMLLKTAVLTFRSFLNRLLSVAILFTPSVCLVTYHFRLNIWLFSILLFYLQILRFYPQLSLKPQILLYFFRIDP